MLSRLLIIVLLVIWDSRTNAAVLKGVILANELGGPPMEEVQVFADGAGQTVSDSAGMFTFKFPEKQPGDPVKVIVKQKEYVVVNDVQLDLALPARGEDRLLTIILCKELDREEMARRFYRLKSFEAIDESYRKRVKELEDTQQATTTELARLRQERDQAKAAAEKTAEALAKNQPGQSSELYREAKRLFLDAKIDEALKLLDDSELRRSLAEAKERRAEADKAVEEVVQVWLLKAQLLTDQLRFNDAEAAYLTAIDAAPDNFEANFNYAVVSYVLNRSETARVAYERCLEWARKNGKNAEQAETLSWLAILDGKQNRWSEAKKEFDEALKISRTLAQESPESNLPDLAWTLNALGLFNRDQHQPEEARQEFDEALKTYRELAQKEPETYLLYVGITLNNLGTLDLDQHRLEECRQAYEEALKTYLGLAQKNPETYLSPEALVLNNLGNLNLEQHRLEEARKEFVEALKTYRELAQKDPESFLPFVALTLNNLSIVDTDQDRNEEARKDVDEALKLSLIHI